MKRVLAFNKFPESLFRVIRATRVRDYSRLAGGKWPACRQKRTDGRGIHKCARPLSGKGDSIYLPALRRSNMLAAAAQPALRRTNVLGSGTVVIVNGVNSATPL